jgi:multiple sugar transport system ATP-binding protein
MLAGLEEVTEGHISIGDRDVTKLSPKERDIAMVFQNYALYPHMSVEQNMAFALKMSHFPRGERLARVTAAATSLGLLELLERKPKALSGGQRQRVAMGRAIVREPQAFLMDEPLSNLDAKLRVQTRAEIAQLQRRLGVTTVYVTHDQVEAMTMADRVAVMNEGRLQQVATPDELYRTPVNTFVAGFIGAPAMNLLPGLVESNALQIGNVTLPLRTLPLPVGSALTVGIRPEHVEIVDDRSPGSLKFKVDVVEALGADSYLYGHVVGGSTPLVVRTQGTAVQLRNQTIDVSFPEEWFHLFDGTTGARL